MYLILELQRYLHIRKKAAQRAQIFAEGQPEEEYYMKESMLQPEEEKPDMEKMFPGIYEKEYERASQLLQRAVFGRKKLEVYERHTLDCFIQRISVALYQNQNFIRKMILRYVYIVRK